MIQILKNMVANYQKEVSRRQKISLSLKRYHATKNYHKVRYSENGVYKFTYLLPNL